MSRIWDRHSCAVRGYLTLTVVVASTAACATRAVTREQIRALYVKWNDLSQRHDIDGIAALLHPDFEYTDEAGRVEPRQAVMDRVQQALAVSRGLRYEVDVRTLHEAGDVATAQTRYVIHMEYQQDGQWVPIVRDLDLVDTFVRQGGGWMLRSSRVVKVNEPR